ncbi:MAG: hypothetical protein WD646_10270 [Actinomycetota bacterium]
MSTSQLEGEQEHVDRAYERLEVLRSEAQSSSVRMAASPGTGSAHALWERDALFSQRRDRVVALTIGDDEPLVFGRIDTNDRERFHVGRVGVLDSDHSSLVVDWRAPAAAAFYRATPGDPKGVVRRRHLHCRGRRVLGLDDELLDSHDPLASELPLVGEAALLRAVDRERTGRMRDIVSTIQVEQDRVIRAPIDGILVVAGGPGTGKTAVGLHRAAYLLYTHRHRLERSGVLLVGPDPIFLRYVEHVLPSLGEGSVRLATAAELVEGVTTSGRDSVAAEAVKGDLRMTKVVRAAVRDRERAIPETVRVLHDGEMLELEPAATQRIIERVAKMRGTHNERRQQVEMALLLHLLDLYRAETKRSAAAGRRGPAPWGTKVPKAEQIEFFEAMLESPRVTEAIDAMWPMLSPQRLLRELYVDASALQRVTKGALTEDESDALGRPPEAAWTPADVALLDEARVLLGPQRGRRPESTEPQMDEEERWIIERMLDDISEFEPIVSVERGWMAERYLDQRADLDRTRGKPPERSTFGHVIVDEAQDLSPMQWRMIARRCPSRSMTILGDLAQASGAWVPTEWTEVLEALRSRREPSVAELTINYRTPAAIMDVADRVIRDVAPGLRRPTSVRAGDGPPRFHRVPVLDLVTEAARHALAEREDLTEGTLALIVPSEIVRDAYARVGEKAGAGPGDLDAPIVVIDPRRAKGLEFDVVVVAEPRKIQDEAGARGLYVTLTRPTQRLVVVHANELPKALQGE